uniref:MMS19 nucleotide excision repair protein n=1 Tax=Panagrolaimus superbus TaxID=310955 RepID=A0A914XYZ6_9BILA
MSSRMPLKDTIQYIIDRIDEFEMFLKTEESAQKLPICTKDFVQICRFIEGHFINFEISDDFDDDKTIHKYQTQAMVCGAFIKLVEMKLPKEILIWIISIYIDLISKRPLGDRLSGKLLNDLLTYSKLLSDNYREKFAEEIIDQWMQLLSGSTEFCLNEQWMKHFYDGTDGFDLFPVKIQFEEEDNVRKVCVIRCLLQLFLYGSFDFSQLPDEKLATLFLCLFKDIFDFRISQLIISLLHKFIGGDLCNGIFFMHTVDALFSFLDFFHRDPISPGSVEAKEKPLIENAIKSCLDKIASIIILPSPLKQLSLCQSITFLPFAARGINLLLSFNLDSPTLLKFVVNSLKNLEATDDLGDFTQLPEDCKKLLRFLIVQCDGKNVDSGFISELFSFLIKFKGVDNTSKLVDNLLQSASINGKKTTEYINVRQTLISVLSPLKNAKQFLAKVVPNENEILQLFQDLKSSKTETKYLSAYFNIIAKSTDFYTGKPDTLLSFLSLPWICDIGWQIWEDFKKALPLLVPIKTDEHNYKDLLSTSSLKSISLKALSQIQSKDQWRSYIFKDALYSTTENGVEVQIAALDALPYLLRTIPTYSFFEVLTPLIENLAKVDNIAASSDSISIVQSLIKAISVCICVSGNQYQILPDKQMCCNLCQTKNGNRKTVRIEFPSVTIHLLTKIVEIEEGENELILEIINLFSATVRHVSNSDEFVEDLIKLSLPLINAGPGIVISYLDFIEEAIKSNLSETIIHSLHEQIYFLQDDLLQLDYFVICGLNSAKFDFAFNCILEVIGKATIRTSRSPKAVEKAVQMIKTLADREGISPRTYFIRNFTPFCQYIRNSAKNVVTV